MAMFFEGDVVKTGDGSFSGTVVNTSGSKVTVKNRNGTKRTFDEGDLKYAV